MLVFRPRTTSSLGWAPGGNLAGGVSTPAGAGASPTTSAIGIDSTARAAPWSWFISAMDAKPLDSLQKESNRMPRRKPATVWQRKEFGCGPWVHVRRRSETRFLEETGFLGHPWFAIRPSAS